METRPEGAAMSVLEILERVKSLANKWEKRKWLTGFDLALWATDDFRALQTEIEKSLEEEADAMFKEHQQARGEAFFNDKD